MPIPVIHGTQMLLRERTANRAGRRAGDSFISRALCHEGFLHINND
jgi:hypothetical protein